MQTEYNMTVHKYLTERGKLMERIVQQRDGLLEIMR
jgi:hypothetical protein